MQQDGYNLRIPAETLDNLTRLVLQVRLRDGNPTKIIGPSGASIDIHQQT